MAILQVHINGRFGNRMFAHAFGVTYAANNNMKYYMPSDWEGLHMFKDKNYEVIDSEAVRFGINQTLKQFDNLEYRAKVMKENLPSYVYIDATKGYNNPHKDVYFDSVCAFDQNIFDGMSKKHLIEIFKLSDEIKSLDIYKRWEDKKGTYDICHLRRDDISNVAINKSGHNPDYSTISIKSYVDAMDKFGINKDNIIWVSDDRTNKWIKQNIPSFGWGYPVGSVWRDGYGFDWLEDFIKIYFARTIFRANSSFSWWASFLSPTATVYSPILTKKTIYGIDGWEIDQEFSLGNENHWLQGYQNIIIKD